MSNKLNVGVIGLGVGSRHVQAYDSHPNASVRIVCDFDNNQLKKMNSDQIITTVNAEDVINDKKVDIVSIASFDNYHKMQIIQAIQNNKHIMAEKPICQDWNELVQIYEAQKDHPHIKLSSNLVLRTNSMFQKFKKDIKYGLFGDVFYFEGDYYWGRKEKLFGWRSEMGFYSIILGAAIHMIDLIMWLLESKPVSVQAIGNNIPTKNTKLKFNSFAIIILKFQNGIIAKVTGNAGCVHPHFHGLKINGTKLTANHEFAGSYYMNSSSPKSNPEPILEPYPEKEVRKNIIHSFLDSIIDESKEPIVNMHDVFDVMSVCFAAEKAMNTGGEIDIEYLN